MTEKEAGDLYDRIIQAATVPVLIFLLIFSLIIINRMMSPEWRKKKRDKQIRKAVAERKRMMEEANAEKQDDAATPQA